MHTYTSNGGWNPYLAGAPERVEDNRYFSEQRIRVDWQFMVVTGIFLEKKRL